MSSPSGEVQASDSNHLPHAPPRMHVLISKDLAQITLPERAAFLSNKIKREGRGTSETRVGVDLETLVKIVRYLNKHAGCPDADCPPMSPTELEEWDRSVFLMEPNRMLLNLLYSALWLEIHDMAILIESKLKPNAEN